MNKGVDNMYSGISFTTNKSVSEILSTLSVLEGYNVKQISDRQAIIHVGSVFKYSFYGVYTSVDYLPPNEYSYYTRFSK